MCCVFLVRRWLWPVKCSDKDRNTMISLCLWAALYVLACPCGSVCVYVRCAIHRLLVSTMSNMSISDIPCCSVGEPPCSSDAHFTSLSSCLPPHPPFLCLCAPGFFFSISCRVSHLLTLPPWPTSLQYLRGKLDYKASLCLTEPSHWFFLVLFFYLLI